MQVKRSSPMSSQVLDPVPGIFLYEHSIMETDQQESGGILKAAGMQFATVELDLAEAKSGVVSHLDDESGPAGGFGELAKRGTEGFTLVSVTPKGDGKAVAILQRPVQTEAELNFIRNAFLLEDLLQVEVEDLPKLVDTLDGDDLVIALKPASDVLRKTFYNALPEKASSTLQEQIEFLMPKSLRAAEAAQERVLRRVKELVRSGDIRLRAKA